MQQLNPNATMRFSNGWFHTQIVSQPWYNICLSVLINWLPCKLIFLCGGHLLRMILPVGLALLQTYWYRVVEYMVLIRALLINKMCSFSRSFNLFEPNHPCTYNAKYEKNAAQLGKLIGYAQQYRSCKIITCTAH